MSSPYRAIFLTVCDPFRQIGSLGVVEKVDWRMVWTEKNHLNNLSSTLSAEIFLLGPVDVQPLLSHGRYHSMAHCRVILSAVSAPSITACRTADSGLLRIPCSRKLTVCLYRAKHLSFGKAIGTANRGFRGSGMAFPLRLFNRPTTPWCARSGTVPRYPRSWPAALPLLEDGPDMGKTASPARDLATSPR